MDKIERIAIVGAGIAGLTCAHYLKDRYQITLLEKNSYIGGHTNTVDVVENGQALAVDTGFIVHNDKTYPNFVRLMDELGVKRQESSMSFGVRCENTGLEYNGTSLNTLFAQRRNLVSPGFWRMLKGIMDFNKRARSFLQDPDPVMTLGQFLKGLPRETVTYYVLPMGAAVWSTPLLQMESFPALFFLRFFENHGFLNINNRPTWKVITGGSREYVRKLTEPFENRIQKGVQVTGVRRTPESVLLEVNGVTHQFDHVILATHADQSLRLLTDVQPREQDILGAIPYTKNEAWLHSDTSFQPRSRRAWASWNYHLCGDAGDKVTVTYNMNILQGLRSEKTWLVTLNPQKPIRPDLVSRKIIYHHPLFTLEGMAAQKRIPEINGTDRVWFCGAWQRNGFHEDGVWSGLQVCRGLGVEP